MDIPRNSVDIACKFVDQIEQFVGLFGINLADFLTTIYEALPLGVHFCLDLLAHSPAQQIGIA